jgi:pimeloyl-ACP methyl ester carboxylesterase
MRFGLSILGLSVAFIAHAQEIDPDFGRGIARSMRVNGTVLMYIETGSGDPLVLVHGAFSDFRYWQPVLAELSRSNRVFAYSRRDFYPNPLDEPPSDSADVDRDDLAAFIEALDVGRVHLVGHSRGGHIALALASVRADLLRSVATIEGGFLNEGVSDAALAALASFGPVAEEATSLFASGDSRRGVDLFLEYALGSKAYGRWSESAKQIAYDNAHTSGRRPQAGLTCAEVSQILTPALLLIGTETPNESKAMMEDVRSCVPGIEVVEIPGASHNVHFDNPSAFVQALEDFTGAH